MPRPQNSGNSWVSGEGLSIDDVRLRYVSGDVELHYGVSSDVTHGGWLMVKEGETNHWGEDVIASNASNNYLGNDGPWISMR